MQVAIVSDTHVPSRASGIPEWVLAEIRAADHTIHAGDFDSHDALATVKRAADGLTAVAGNLDPADLGLPEATAVALGGVEFVVTHGTGPLSGYEQRVRATVAEAGEPDAVGVSGHTHELLDTTVEGTRLLNPGSATGADPASETTMLRATVADGALDVDVVRS
jgi:putative phosphoesterase